MADRPVPGLAIMRDIGPRESWDVVHALTGRPVICGLAGPATAEWAAEDLGRVLEMAARDLGHPLDWTAPPERIAGAADRLEYVEPAVDAIARRHDGVTLGEMAVYAP